MQSIIERKPLRYLEWLEFVFGREKTENGWYFDCEDASFEADDQDIALLVTYTFKNCGTDLIKFSDAQVNDGLKYIFDNSCSNVVFALMSDAVDDAAKLALIFSIRNLYDDCFGPRCAPVLGHTNEPGGSSLNYICYMLWDLTPLSGWDKRVGQESEIFYNAIIDVLRHSLESTNPACVESALHGLGHIMSSSSGRCTEVIKKYLRTNTTVSNVLKEYARRASTGNIQ